MRVLVAEDNVVNQRIALRFLERLGAEVVLACDGADAVECVRKDRDGFDLVLMDCQMPRLDGYAATTQIRALYDASRLPIIAVSANVVRSDLERCLAVGMNDVLPKPYTVEQLKTAISRWMPPAPGTCAEV
jgi:CheY-like chemotaxis protein